MILSQSEAYELGNALLNAYESIEHTNDTIHICRMDSGEMFDCKHSKQDEGIDNGFETVAIINK